MNEKQIMIENRVVSYCPKCWTRDNLLRTHPGLRGYKFSSSICSEHLMKQITIQERQILRLRKFSFSSLGAWSSDI